MKLPLVFAVAVLLAIPAISRGDLVILQDVEGAGQSGQMTLKIKGEKTRADISAQMSSLTDSASGDSVMLMHSQKSYMKISGDRTKALMEKMKNFQELTGTGGGGQSVALPKATGKKQRIGGYETEEYSCQMGSTNVRYWVTRNFPNWEQLQEQMMKSQEKNLSRLLKGKVVSLKDLPGMPVRTEIEFNGQKISYTVLSVKEEEVSPKEFEIPTGYKELAMPSFSAGKE